MLDSVASLRAAGHRVTVLFLDAQEAELVRRYDATRRKHPLAAETDGLVESIQLERSLLDGTRGAADLVIDTSDLNIHQLKDRLVAAFDDDSTTSRLQVAVESFGFKHGLPLDADIVMDVRFLPNPHWEEELRPLTGHDPAVRDFVLERADTAVFIERLDDLLRTILPWYESRGAHTSPWPSAAPAVATVPWPSPRSSRPVSAPAAPPSAPPIATSPAEVLCRVSSLSGRRSGQNPVFGRRLGSRV